jgi:hypothetical protein
MPGLLDLPYFIPNMPPEDDNNFQKFLIGIVGVITAVLIYSIK